MQNSSERQKESKLLKKEQEALKRAKAEYKMDEGDVMSRQGAFQLKALYQKWLQILSMEDGCLHRFSK